VKGEAQIYLEQQMYFKEFLDGIIGDIGTI
jgi:hypothetical protein